MSVLRNGWDVEVARTSFDLRMPFGVVGNPWCEISFEFDPFRPRIGLKAELDVACLGAWLKRALLFVIGYKLTVLELD